MSGQHQTISQCFLSRASGDASKTAWRRKERGVWHTVSWAEALHEVSTLAQGLADNGLRRGDSVLICADKTHHWVVAAHAIQGLGAIVAPIMPDVSPREAGSCLEQIKTPKMILVESENALSAVSSACSASGFNGPIFVGKSNKGTVNATDGAGRSQSQIQTWPRVDKDKGDADLAIEFFKKEVRKGQSDDLASIFFQTGETGNLETVSLSHRAWLENVSVFTQHLQLSGSDQTICTLAPAYAAAKLLYQVAPAIHGYCVNFPETSETILADMREIGPTQVLVSPAGCKHIAVSSIAQMKSAGWIKRSLFEAGQDRYKKQAQSGNAAVGGIWGALGATLVCRPIREVLGLSRVKSVLTYPMHLGDDATAFFSSIGLKFKKVEESKPLEISGLLTLQVSDFSATETSTPNESVKIQVVLDDSQQLTVERDIEGALCTSAYIRRAVVFSSGTDDATALIQLDHLASKDWADRQGLHYESVDQLSLNPEMLQLVEDEIRLRVSDKSNSTNISNDPNRAVVGKFVVLRKDLDPDQGELTHLRTPNYQTVVRNYAWLIGSLDANHEGESSTATASSSKRLFRLKDSHGLDYGGAQIGG